MSSVVEFKRPSGRPETVSETRLVTVAGLEEWVRPPFQRPITVNKKVLAFAADLKENGGIIGGVITLGKLPNDPTIYKVDGMHRIEAARISELPEFYIELRITQFQTMAQMAAEYMRLNDKLVNMKPDDLMRALEQNSPPLQEIRRICDFVGYDNIRKSTSNSLVIGMSALIKCWFTSKCETPSSGGLEPSLELVDRLDETEVRDMTAFLNVAYGAWGNDPENYRLWSNLNLIMCMWMFRVLVLKHESKKTVMLNAAQFGRCLMSVSADSAYVDWLLGRKLGERDRSPCYSRLKTIFGRRLIEDNANKRPMFPQPAWAMGGKR